jgi:hypothetical protein
LQLSRRFLAVNFLHQYSRFHQALNIALFRCNVTFSPLQKQAFFYIFFSHIFSFLSPFVEEARFGLFYYKLKQQSKGEIFATKPSSLLQSL